MKATIIKGDLVKHTGLLNWEYSSPGLVLDITCKGRHVTAECMWSDGKILFAQLRHLTLVSKGDHGINVHYPKALL